MPPLVVRCRAAASSTECLPLNSLRRMEAIRKPIPNKPLLQPTSTRKLLRSPNSKLHMEAIKHLNKVITVPLPSQVVQELPVSPRAWGGCNSEVSLNNNISSPVKPSHNNQLELARSTSYIPLT
jgi:hypothetical protein